uniref:Uncharacterized protein n=1 Tax=Anguilla anguilla TaxID=7936 RepID=A0A0E9TV93_ANGAN
MLKLSLWSMLAASSFNHHCSRNLKGNPHFNLEFSSSNVKIGRYCS